MAGAMDFEVVIRRLSAELESAGVRYALIGGFAMALRGVQRATVDLDFILMLEDLEKTHLILQGLGYERVFHSENVSHYLSPDRDWGRIDILHAFRGPTLGMLKRAEKLPVLGDVRLPVVQVEDIIGLKVQAAVNAPERATRDWADIRMILEAAAAQRRAIDWQLVADYLGIFNLRDKLPELRTWHGEDR